ncbi:MAG: hypothetical protein C4326_11935 [Ignavibacteria bacterium]
MTLMQEYKASLKMAEAEELLDLIFYRPLAFIIVKIISRLPITPNQMTYAALVAGLLSAMQFAQGTAKGFLWGAIWYGVANVLDCGDGMLARLQRSGTPLGRLVDGVVDWVSSIAIFYGLGVGMSAFFGSPLYWLLAIGAGVLSGYHAMVFDKRQQEYITAVRNEENFFQREYAKIQHQLHSSRSPFRRLVLAVYSWYLKVQEETENTKHTPTVCSGETYRTHHRHIMRWWTWLGPTTNRSLLIIAGILSHPDWFCWIVIFPLNVYLVGMMVWQSRAQQRLDRAVRDSSRSAPVTA